MEIKIRKRGMSGNIPFEMQVEIMRWLPVKSLAVFRSVSKAWKSMIDSPLFIADYTNFHQHHRILIRYQVAKKIYRKNKYKLGPIASNVVKFLPCYKTKLKYISIVDNDEFDTVCNVPVPFQRFQREKLVGMSQGLICLSGISVRGSCHKETAVIWNPSLGKSIAVDVAFEHKRGVPVFGFGVRPDNCDPMIVRINGVGQLYPFLLFTLSSQVWRVPRGNLPPKSIYIYDMRITVPTHDRRIYWKAHERQTHINLVAAFDMVTEDFTEINLPHCVAHQFFGDFSISIIKDSLALLDYTYDADKPVCDVWMMVEDGASKSFTKLFTIKTPSTYIEVLGFRKDDQPIMETRTIDDYWPASLELYEPCTGNTKNLGINGEHNSFFCCSYTETLLLLDQLDEQFVKIQLQL